MPSGILGRDLLSDSASLGFSIQEGVLPMVSIRTDQYRLLFEGIPLSSPFFNLALASAPLEPPWFALYDLNVDPNGINNVVEEQPTIAEELRREILSWNRSIVKSGITGQQPSDPKLKELLRSRGYW